MASSTTSRPALVPCEVTQVLLTRVCFLFSPISSLLWMLPECDPLLRVLLDQRVLTKKHYKAKHNGGMRGKEGAARLGNQSRPMDKPRAQRTSMTMDLGRGELP